MSYFGTDPGDLTPEEMFGREPVPAPRPSETPLPASSPLVWRKLPGDCLHEFGYNAAGMCFDCGAKIGMSINEYAGVGNLTPVPPPSDGIRLDLNIKQLFAMQQQNFDDLYRLAKEFEAERDDLRRQLEARRSPSVPTTTQEQRDTGAADATYWRDKAKHMAALMAMAGATLCEPVSTANIRDAKKSCDLGVHVMREIIEDEKRAARVQGEDRQ